MTLRHEHRAERVHTRAFNRLKLIDEEIRAGCYPNVCALAHKLERSERTVKRDLRSLRDDFHAPLVFDRARGGFRYREPGWTLPPYSFDEGELLAFFTAEHLLRTAGLAPEAILLRATLAKLAAYLPPEVSVNAATLGEALTFQQLPHVAVQPATLQTLARAAAERRTVAFDYHSQHRNQRTQRTADVLLLHNFAGDWYAIAFDHLRREVRDFHAGRMTRLALTERYFEPPANWRADDYLRRGFYMMRGGRTTIVSLVFDSYQARWMRERQTFHPDERREDLAGGALRLSFPVGRNGLEAVARFCLAYAGHCRAERPVALRRLIHERLTRALADHSEDSPAARARARQHSDQTANKRPSLRAGAKTTEN
jgi:predicted DNA-binding transcriptional regulator YafY